MYCCTDRYTHKYCNLFKSIIHQIRYINSNYLTSSLEICFLLLFPSVVLGTTAWNSDAEKQEVKRTCCCKWKDAVKIFRKILIRVQLPDLFVVLLLFLLLSPLPLLLLATPRLSHDDDRDGEIQRGRRREGMRREEGEGTDQHSQWHHGHSACHVYFFSLISSSPLC